MNTDITASAKPEYPVIDRNPPFTKVVGNFNFLDYCRFATITGVSVTVGYLSDFEMDRDKARYKGTVDGYWRIDRPYGGFHRLLHCTEITFGVELFCVKSALADLYGNVDWSRRQEALIWQIHGLIIKLYFDSDIIVASGLLDMYGKSENIEDAQKAFDDMATKNAVSWSSRVVKLLREVKLWAGRDGKEAIKLLKEILLREVFAPDELTLASVLSSCGNASEQVVKLCKSMLMQ
ncbi:hypothetical protein GH714_038706 [Hevea brasiliensis]|uniref:NADH-ubiquinone oxidoreductase 21kDa subunit N-terminal domain-containing protein n=1 Tax=Hevea brasiliensis TaxID=3981 RepID=A0A6A6MSL3_HEVBR|nr:hypothetical protein GH714_038706 [Hevea brasiliensis]